jgi:hypothetical protein
MNEEELKIIRSLREKGYAIVIFSPRELQNVPPGKLEDDLRTIGWDTIDTLRN